MASEYSSIRLWAWKYTRVPHYTVVHVHVLLVELMELHVEIVLHLKCIQYMYVQKYMLCLRRWELLKT